jgi:hypothetical protein
VLQTFLGVRRPQRELTTKLDQAPRSRVLELYLHSPIRLRGMHNFIFTFTSHLCLGLSSSLLQANFSFEMLRALWPNPSHPSHLSPLITSGVAYKLWKSPLHHSLQLPVTSSSLIRYKYSSQPPVLKHTHATTTTAFWDVTPCSFVQRNQCIGGICFLSLQGGGTQLLTFPSTTLVPPRGPPTSQCPPMGRLLYWLKPLPCTLKMEVAGSSETLVRTYKATLRHIPEDCNLDIHTLCAQTVDFLMSKRVVHLVTISL